VRHDWPYPKLVLEPGRWLAGRAGVAVYSIGMQKTTPNGVHIIAVDGGLADNPRVALYQARYSALVVEAPQGNPSEKVRVVGKFCESGDVLIQETHLPPAVRGQHLAIPVSGAYQLSMSSNYNYASRPAVLWLENGQVEMLQPREDLESSPWLVYEP
jgi:diaminopimelate decarboxylase